MVVGPLGIGADVASPDWQLVGSLDRRRCLVPKEEPEERGRRLLEVNPPQPRHPQVVRRRPVPLGLVKVEPEVYAVLKTNQKPDRCCDGDVARIGGQG